MASPVIITMLTRSASTSLQTSCGIEPGDEHDLVAGEALSHHPPLGGTVHEGSDRQEGDLAACREAFFDHGFGPVHAYVW